MKHRKNLGIQPSEQMKLLKFLGIEPTLIIWNPSQDFLNDQPNLKILSINNNLLGEVDFSTLPSMPKESLFHLTFDLQYFYIRIKNRFLKKTVLSLSNCTWEIHKYHQSIQNSKLGDWKKPIWKSLTSVKTGTRIKILEN